MTKTTRLPRRLLLCLSFAVSAVVSSYAASTNGYYLQDGDRVVFYGDSITEQQFYTMLVEDYTLTRFPSMKVNFVNSGWGGDSAARSAGGAIELRLSRDVLAYNPSVVTIMLGMNDGHSREYDQTFFDAYKTGYISILDTLTSRLKGVRITLLQPSAYDDITHPPTFPGGYNGVLKKYGDFVANLADSRHMTQADLNGAVVSGLRRATQLDPQLAGAILPDRVHPRPAGHLWMAETLLKSWGATPVVSEVKIDARKGNIDRADNTTVNSLSIGNTISWTQADRALPLPLDLTDPLVELALRSSDFMDALDRETLEVEELPRPAYELRIDGKSVGKFSAEQFAHGINLAGLLTPMLQQALKMHRLTEEHNKVHYVRWRDIQYPFAKEDSAEIEQAERVLDKSEQELVVQQRAAAQPGTFTYELVAIP